MTKLLAQQSEKPFESIRILGSGSYFLTDNLEDIGWYSTYGVKLGAELPFYFGQVGFGINFNPYNSQQDLPKMNIWSINLYWGETIMISKYLGVYTGIALGTCFLSFEGNQLTQYERLENELTVGANARLIFNVTKHLGIHFSLGINKIFTNNNIRQADVGAGFDYKFSTGKWIKEFLN